MPKIIILVNKATLKPPQTRQLDWGPCTNSACSRLQKEVLPELFKPRLSPVMNAPWIRSLSSQIHFASRRSRVKSHFSLVLSIQHSTTPADPAEPQRAPGTSAGPWSSRPRWLGPRQPPRALRAGEQLASSASSVTPGTAAVLQPDVFSPPPGEEQSWCTSHASTENLPTQPSIQVQHLLCLHVFSQNK